MRPPVTLGVYKILPSDTTLCDVRLPAGTAVGFNAVAMMRRKDIFGDDSQLFRPERFLDCDEKVKLEMIHTVELAFGYGRWMCAGKTLALMELNKIFFEVIVLLPTRLRTIELMSFCDEAVEGIRFSGYISGKAMEGKCYNGISAE